MRDGGRPENWPQTSSVGSVFIVAEWGSPKGRIYFAFAAVKLPPTPNSSTFREPLIFSADDLEMMRKLKAAFNPTGMLNPGKVLPTGKICGELRVQVSAGAAA